MAPSVGGSFTMFLTFLLLCATARLSSGVLPIPEVNMTALLYDNVVLPCHFGFVKTLSGLTVIWEKKEYQRKQILYKLLNGEENLEEQDPRYRGQVQLSGDNSQGNLSLTLRNVTYEDEGTYYCRAANIRNHGDRKVNLSIVALDADNTTVTLVTVGGHRRMKCRGSGVYHVPRIQWITTQGEDLSSYGKDNITDLSNGRKLVESVLEYEVERNLQILCHIFEGRLKRSARAVISDGTRSVTVDDNPQLSSDRQQRTSATDSELQHKKWLKRCR